MEKADRQYFLRLAIWLLFLIGVSLFFVGRPLMTESFTTDEEMERDLYLYLRADHKAPVTMVGSSLVRALQPQYFDTGCCATLGISGANSLLGLELMNRFDLLPEVILVETNLLFRSRKDMEPARPKHLIASYPNPLVPLMMFRPLRDALHIAMNGFSPRFSQSEQTLRRQTQNQAILKAPANPGVSEEEITAALKNYETYKPDEVRQTVEKILADMAPLLQSFRDRGVAIFFLDMPLPPRVEKVFTYAISREVAKKFAAENGFEWVPELEDKSEIKWVDHVHLEERPRVVFARHLESFLKKRQR